MLWEALVIPSDYSLSLMLDVWIDECIITCCNQPQVQTDGSAVLKATGFRTKSV